MLGQELEQEDRPFIIADGVIDSWPCTHWTLRQWADQLAERRFTFRVHPTVPKCKQVNWENEAVAYVEATVAHLLAHTRINGKESIIDAVDETTGANPFEPFPADEYCFYSGYNYLNESFLSGSPIVDSIRWQETGLPERKLLNDGRNSTLWLGTGGSSTPCHLDTYGYNFVAQLHGRKLWILFPPNQAESLYPTRIPFEESSIFSQVNIQRIDLLRFPLFRHSRPRIVELKAGEILFVPRHWWHFVQNVSESAEDISISVNTWITGDERENSLSEALVQFLARPLLDAYGDSSWLNLNADLMEAPEVVPIIKALINTDSSPEGPQGSQAEAKEDAGEASMGKHPTALKKLYLEEGTVEDIVRCTSQEASILSVDEKQSARGQEIDLKDVVNCILDSEVIDLIKSKLQKCASSRRSNAKLN